MGGATKQTNKANNQEQSPDRCIQAGTRHWKITGLDAVLATQMWPNVKPTLTRDVMAACALLDAVQDQSGDGALSKPNDTSSTLIQIKCYSSTMEYNGTNMG